MSRKSNLAEIVQELAESQRLYDRLTEDEEVEREIGAPASDAQVALLEGLLGRPLPPSYRAFLAIHNGWECFDGGAKLLSVEDHGADWVKKRLQGLSILFEDKSDNPFEHGAIPILLGVDEHNYLVLDPRTARENGEMDFVSYDYGQEEDRFDDFESFLQDALNVLKELIEEEREGILEDEDEV